MSETTKFTIEIELPQAPIEEAARKALDSLLGTPRNYNGRGGDGYEIIKAKITDHVQGFDVTPLVEEMLESVVKTVVADVVSEALTSVVKSRVNELKRDGTLATMAAKMLPSLAVPEEQEVDNGS